MRCKNLKKIDSKYQKLIIENVDTAQPSLSIYHNFLFFNKGGNFYYFDNNKNELFDFHGLNPYPRTLKNGKIFCSKTSLENFVNLNWQN